jgi:hypothetical protein
MSRIESETHDPSLIRIFRDLKDDATALLRQEVALAKREMAAKASTMARNTIFLVLGGFVGCYCLLFLLLSADSLLQAGLFATGFSGTVSAWLAPLLLGMLLGITALFLTLKSLRTLRKQKPVPEQTLATLREDRDWLKGRER